MNSKRTAISRKTASRPLRAALKLNAIQGKVLDYGCGKGKDVEELQKLGFKVTGYDPYFQPRRPRGRFQTVLMTYVVNVLEVSDRNAAILDAWKYVKKGGRLIITARTEAEIYDAATAGDWREVAWGFITNSGTYQRGYLSVQLVRLALRLLDGIKNVQTGPINAGGAMIIILKS